MGDPRETLRDGLAEALREMLVRLGPNATALAAVRTDLPLSGAERDDAARIAVDWLLAHRDEVIAALGGETVGWFTPLHNFIPVGSDPYDEMRREAGIDVPLYRFPGGEG